MYRIKYGCQISEIIGNYIDTTKVCEVVRVLDNYSLVKIEEFCLSMDQNIYVNGYYYRVENLVREEIFCRRELFVCRLLESKCCYYEQFCECPMCSQTFPYHPNLSLNFL